MMSTSTSGNLLATSPLVATLAMAWLAERKSGAMSRTVTLLAPWRGLTVRALCRNLPGVASLRGSGGGEKVSSMCAGQQSPFSVTAMVAGTVMVMSPGDENGSVEVRDRSATDVSWETSSFGVGD